MMVSAKCKVQSVPRLSLESLQYKLQFWSILKYVVNRTAETALRDVLDSIETAEELENALKERYGVGSLSKKPRTATVVVSPPASSLRPQAAPPQGGKLLDDSPIPNTTVLNSHADLAGLLYIGAGLKDPCQNSKPTCGEGQELVQSRTGTTVGDSKSEPEGIDLKINPVTKDSSSKDANDLSEASKVLQSPPEVKAATTDSAEAKPKGLHTKPPQPVQNSWDAMLSNQMWRMPFGPLQAGDTPISTLLPPVPPLTLFPLASEARHAVSSVGNGTALPLPLTIGTLPGKGVAEDGQRMLKYHLKYHADRPGRPPSYDDMVVWCVNLKRCLWRRHVPLTIEEAVALVNDAYPCAAKHMAIQTEGKGKSLVASTLRKRVLGIFKLTWSQVATDADPGSNDEILDPSVLAAASIKLKRQGMVDPIHGLNRNIDLALTKKGPPHKSQAFPAQKSTAGLVHSPITGTNGIPEGHLPDQASPVRMNDESKDEVSPKPLDSTTLPSAPAHVHEIIKKGTLQNLTPDEAYDLLSNCQAYGLPLCSRPGLRPGAGSLYLFDRKFTPGFRCDGYDFMRRETHAKRKVGEEVKLNCYYAGGPEDPIQRRCYWLLDENIGEKRDSVADLVLVHYLDSKGVGNVGRDGDDVHHQCIPQVPVQGIGANTHEVAVDERRASHMFALARFATANVSDPDSMFDAMCTLHNVSGISKQEQATICRLWMDNVLDDIQKKQLFMYIKANLKDQDAVADWVKGVIHKNKDGSTKATE